MPYRCYTSWIFIVFDQFGIEFPYKGDIVIWLWPWRRKNTKTSYHDINKYVSILSEGYFDNLSEIDKFWEGFEEACRISAKDNTNYTNNNG